MIFIGKEYIPGKSFTTMSFSDGFYVRFLSGRQDEVSAIRCVVVVQLPNGMYKGHYKHQRFIGLFSGLVLFVLSILSKHRINLGLWELFKLKCFTLANAISCGFRRIYLLGLLSLRPSDKINCVILALSIIFCRLCGKSADFYNT